MIFESEANYPHPVETKAKPVKLGTVETRARKRVLAAREKVAPKREKNRKHCTLLGVNCETRGSKRSFVDISVG